MGNGPMCTRDTPCCTAGMGECEGCSWSKRERSQHPTSAQIRLSALASSSARRRGSTAEEVCYDCEYGEDCHGDPPPSCTTDVSTQISVLHWTPSPGSTW
jgi:hypothetical protein